MGYWTYFLPKAPWLWVYMLQLSEYESRYFIKWLLGFPNLLQIRQRHTLDLTARAKITLVISYVLWLVSFLFGFGLINYGQLGAGIIVILFTPLVAIVLLAATNYMFGQVIVKPVENKEIRRASQKLAALQATTIAVLGSYGKTTMKEILSSVLSQGKKTASTPGNKNVLISHARWVNNQLAGDEEVLIFEYGEDRPGDIKTLSAFSRPSIAVVTGLAPAHMEKYGDLDAIALDFKSVQDINKNTQLFINAESSELISRLKEGVPYSGQAVAEWKVILNKSELSGLEFTMEKAGRRLHLRSGLVGKHLLGPLALAVNVADSLGLSDQQITDGIAATKPFEHRMQPYQLSGAWVVDDTYNGNLEGMKAGLELLKSLPAKRRIYITPGLVEQGGLKRSVHEELGKAIAGSAPDKVVLMKNSTTDDIVRGMESASYSGDLEIVTKPLAFYTNLEHFVATGDVVLMQNDWPDNYQ